MQPLTITDADRTNTTQVRLEKGLTAAFVSLSKDDGTTIVALLPKPRARALGEWLLEYADSKQRKE